MKGWFAFLGFFLKNNRPRCGCDVARSLSEASGVRFGAGEFYKIAERVLGGFFRVNGFVRGFVDVLRVIEAIKHGHSAKISE